MIQPKTKEVHLSGEVVTVSELTVGGLGRLLPLVDGLMAAFKGDEVSESEVLEFISRHWDQAVGLLEDCTSLGPDVRNAGASALPPLLAAFWEVNKDFFGHMATAKGAVAEAAADSREG